MVDKITELATDRPIIESDGSLTIQSRTYFRTLTVQALIIGTGNPEGVVEAEQGAQYMDDTGTASNIMYRKRDNDDGIAPTPDKSKGWILT